MKLAKLFGTSLGCPSRPAGRVTAAAILSLSSIAMVTVAASGPFTSRAAAAPGTPTVPQAGVPVFTEDFSGLDASAAPISLAGYTGGPTSGAMTYTADAAWSPGAFACNGWILRYNTPVPVLPAVPAPDTNDQCDRNTGMTQLGRIAEALGQFQNQGAAAIDNQVLSAYTNSVSGVQAAGLQLVTSGSISAAGGRFYAVSALFAQTNCFSNHAQQRFDLVVNGVVNTLGTGLDPCTGPEIDVEGTFVRVTKLQSAAIKMPAGPVNLGLQVFNAQNTGNGNDVAFDLPQIVDVTPQIDIAFTPPTIPFGATSTVTFTVTNTDDLQAKTGWSFTDALPAGLTATGVNSTTCDSGTVTAAAGATAIAAGGNLTLGQASCTITVEVTPAPGTYVNSGCIDSTGAVVAGCVSSFTVDGVNPPAGATLTVTPVIDAVDDAYGLQTPGATTGTVLVNDTANLSPASAANVILTAGTPSNPGLSMNANGTITIAPTTPPGSYTYPYTICLVSSPTTCDTATATLSVAAVINAVDDPFGVQTPGATTGSVISNDTLNGNPATVGAGGNVVLTPGTPSSPGVAMNADGTITVATSTPAGSFAYPYTICSSVLPTICDQATATLTISPAAGAGPGTVLPRTGARTGVALRIAGACLLLGLLTLGVSRRRRRSIA